MSDFRMPITINDDVLAPIPTSSSSTLYAEGYDPVAIVVSARNCSSEEEAIHLFQATLLNWVDDYSARAAETQQGGFEQFNGQSQWKEAIVSLWIFYAEFHRKSKLAVEVFETALHCPVANNSLRLWKTYAQWLHSKGKPKAAQEIYLRALIGNQQQPAADLSSEHREELWADFHTFIMSLRGQVTHSLQDFKSTVLYEHATTNLHWQGTSTEVHETPVAHCMSQPIPDASTVTLISNQLLADIQKVSPDITAEWLARDGAGQPSRPEPPLFQASPPKWLDATGKDLLGTQLALQLIRLLLKTHDRDFVGNSILDIAHACWMMNALKEKEATRALEDLDQKLMMSRKQLDAELEARLSVTASYSTSMVEQLNHQDILGFMENCNRQRVQLLNYLAWDFRHLLAIQQQILTKAGCPGFYGVTCDAQMIERQSYVCGFLHSAFFLRARVGETSHMSMLRKQEERLTQL